jgi:hypothetical protein
VSVHINLHVINLIYPNFDYPWYRLAFFKAAYHMFDAEFYVKADDDIYLRPGEVSVYVLQLLFDRFLDPLYDSFSYF